MGLTPIRLEASAASRPEAARWVLIPKRVATRDLILFVRQLETMLEAGLPILSALEILHQQTTHPVLKAAIDRVRSDVEQGSTLTEALRRHPRCFPAVFTSLIHAGEEGGLLASMLDRELTRAVRSAESNPGAGGNCVVLHVRRRWSVSST